MERHTGPMPVTFMGNAKGRYIVLMRNQQYSMYLVRRKQCECPSVPIKSNRIGCDTRIGMLLDRIVFLPGLDPGIGRGTVLLFSGDSPGSAIEYDTCRETGWPGCHPLLERLGKLAMLATRSSRRQQNVLLMDELRCGNET